MDILLVVLVAVLPILPFVAIFVIVRYGPIRNPWWRGEPPLVVATLAGFIGAFVAGLAWGWIRARRADNP